MQNIYLKKREERRIKAGHLWVYSNEVDTHRSPLKGLEAGGLVRVVAHSGEILGLGYANPASLIAVRLLYRGKQLPEDVSLLLRERLENALIWREQSFTQPYYRLVHSEGDCLPGLIVDRFGDYLVVQFGTAGAEALRDNLVALLQELIKPKAILIRGDARGRELEGLATHEPEIIGDWPQTLTVMEGDCEFLLPDSGGQKTGWFYDQRPNREAFLRWVKGRRVLDVFSYIGGWGVQAAKAGASEVTCIDASSSVCEQVLANAAHNKVDLEVIAEDGFKALAALKASGRQFDVIVVDPPALIQRKKDQRNGIQAYQRLNELALDCLAANGVLVSASCSHHLPANELQTVVRRAANKKDRALSIVARGGAGLDHPVHPAIPETEYLKAVFSKVS